MHEGKVVIKRELMPDGRQKLIVKDLARATSATWSSPVDRPPPPAMASSRPIRAAEADQAREGLTREELFDDHRGGTDDACKRRATIAG